MTRIDWKTYDYSEGPPRSSSSSNSSTHPYVTTSSFIKTRPAYHSVTFSSSDDLTKPKTATKKSLTKLSGADADEFLPNKRSLSYRPANHNPSPVSAALVSDDDDDDDYDPTEDLPFDVQKNTATNTIKSTTTTTTTTQDSHFNHEDQSLYNNQNHEINHSKVHPIRYSSFSNMIGKEHQPVKPALIENDTDKENILMNDTKNHDKDEGIVSETESFEEEWQKAEEEWKLAEELEQQKQRAHSKHEQEQPQPQEQDTAKDDIIAEKQVYPIQQQTQKKSAEVPSQHNRSNNNSDNEYYEFDSFAGDRSIVTTGNYTAASSLIGTHLLPADSSACPSIVSEVDSNISSHVAGVPINLLPPSILRTNGRFDTIAVALEEGKQPVEDNRLTNTKKKHQGEVKSNNLPPSQELLDQIQKILDVSISNVDDASGSKKSPTTTPSPTKSSPGDGESQTSSRKKSHRRRNKDSSDKTDDDSIEDKSPRKSVGTLQDRTKQAWSVRNKAAAAASSSKPRSNDLVKGSSISFEKKNTIHEFIPDSESERDDDEEVSFHEDSDTLFSDDDTRTIDTANSWYTKSALSEAEDLIKDMLLIGEGEYTNPGRRHRDYEKLKKKRKMQAKGNMSGTTQSERDSQIDKEIADSMVLKELQSDPLSIIFDAVESGVTMLSSSLCNAYYSISSFKPAQLVDENETIDDNRSVNEKSGGNNDEFFVPASVPSFQDYDGDVTNITDEFTVDETETRALALGAAKLHHKSKGLKYDETSQLNYPKEFRLINVILGLPIGLILADGEVCCAISEVLPHGNARKVTANDPLLKGDSLVSINGISTYNKKVGQICQILSVQPNPERIRMTFMRYIGPLRSTIGLDEFQGFEVSKPSVSESFSLKRMNSKKFLQSHNLNTVNDKQVSKVPSSPSRFSKKISFKLSKSNNLKTVDNNNVQSPMEVTTKTSQKQTSSKTSVKDVVVQSKSNESKSSESGKKKGKLSRLFKRGKKKETEI